MPSQRLGSSFASLSSVYRAALCLQPAACRKQASDGILAGCDCRLFVLRVCDAMAWVPDRYMGTDGEMRRPWCPATRVLEHREAQRMQAEADRKRSTAMQQALRGPGRKQPRTDFPPLQAGSARYAMQCLINAAYIGMASAALDGNPTCVCSAYHCCTLR